MKDKKIKDLTPETIKLLVETSKSIGDICKKLGYAITGYNCNRIKEIIANEGLEMKPVDKCLCGNSRIPLNEILVDNSKYNNNYRLKIRLIKENMLEYKCSGKNCVNIGIWLGKPLSLQLDHINGINNDNRIDNLRIICPNCNAGLETFSGKNIKKRTNSNFYTRSDNFDIDRNKKNIRSIGKICVCGNTIKSDSMMCVKCNNISQRKVERPEHSILIKEVSEIGFLATGRKYGVSDNSIRKWIKKG